MAGGWQRALPGWLAGPKDTPDKVRVRVRVEVRDRVRVKVKDRVKG